MPVELWEYMVKNYLHTKEDYRAVKNTCHMLRKHLSEKRIQYEFCNNNIQIIKYGTTTFIRMFEYLALFSDSGSYIYTKNGKIHRDDDLPAVCGVRTMSGQTCNPYFEDLYGVITQHVTTDMIYFYIKIDKCITNCTSLEIYCNFTNNAKYYEYYHNDTIYNINLGLCGIGNNYIKIREECDDILRANCNVIFKMDPNMIMSYILDDNTYYLSELDIGLSSQNGGRNVRDIISNNISPDKMESYKELWKKTMNDINAREQLFSPTAYTCV
jgi:hypothetical protein